VSAPLSSVQRLLLWDYERGSLAYDLLVLVVIAFLALATPAWLPDPMVRP
jgi:hypothetical protein